MIWVPEVAVELVQGAEQEVALVDDQVRVLVAFGATEVGLAERLVEIIGGPPARFITTKSVAEFVPSVQTIVMVIGPPVVG